MVTMTPLQSWLRTGCVIALTLGGLLTYWDFHLTQVVTRSSLEFAAKAVPDLAPTVTAANKMLADLSAPCKDFQGDWVCGPIPQLAQTEKNIGILAARSAQQVQQTGTLVTAVAHNLDTVGDSVKTVAGRLSVTADAATGTLNAATGTLDTVNGRAGPLMDAYTQSGVDLDKLLKNKAITQTFTNTAAITGNVAGITHSLDLIGAHLETTVDKPQPLWKALIPGAELGGKLYACAFYHVCVN